MGRGRAKAKQTKVARQLKYNSGGFDASRLANELGVSPNETVNPEPFDDDEDEDDPYASYAHMYDDEDDEEEDESPSRKRA